MASFPPSPKKTLKIVILGDSGVGKTSLLNRYSTGKFTGQYKATIGADFMSKDIVVEGLYGGNGRQLVTLQLWDTAGQERFQSLGVGFYRGADACVLVYDITDPQSLDHMDHWRREFLEHQQQSQSSSMGGGTAVFPFVVLGNKVDKPARDRLVPQEAAAELCRSMAVQSAALLFGGGNMVSASLPHYETSAKTAESVEEAFQEVARRALAYEDYKQRSQPKLFVPPPTSGINLRAAQQQHQQSQLNSGCC